MAKLMEENEEKKLKFNASELLPKDVNKDWFETDFSNAETILKQTSKSLGGGQVEVDDDIAKISIVGRGMRANAGVASKMFQALAENEINISMITTSEIKISVVIKKNEMKDAMKALHDAFDLDKEHLFLFHSLSLLLMILMVFRA